MSYKITNKKKLNFYIKTYGCQMNVYDSEMVAGLLTDKGYQNTTNIDNADIIIFNSCTVRQHAEDRVVGRITFEMRRKTEKPSLLIGLIGCVAQRVGKELIKKIHGLDFAVGTDNYKALPEIIRTCMAEKKQITSVGQNKNENYKNICPLRNEGINAFVTIMRGCDNFCSYCIVPYVRGRERSRDLEEIIREVEQAGKNGFGDITLLGQNVNSYHFGDCNFADLLGKVAHIDSIKRLRFVTSHPKDISEKVISTMAKEDKICEHLHLPMQAGSNRILGKMNRKYSIEHYYEIIKKLRKAMPDIVITSDIMVGFPGETEEDFQKTMSAVKKIGFDSAFTFKYSPRNGTAAEKYDNQIPEEIRLERLQKLFKLQEKITLQKYQEDVGKSMEVYVEQTSKKNKNELSGRTRGSKIVIFPGEKSLIGKLVNVKITNSTGWILRGKI
ncbi:MAG: tRNA (N6-isopentenyl adenosine(37)-C2)-methylthiotransferase MiaB [Candidatus Cloacimonadota bacterium]|nr:tRNA (N6-isopentenyl adenosine(37)-C2)-methylthiotransferase MiaB [Candidatus Cloacimonadota bacterium]